MNNTPLVTIIIPVYNGEKYLGECFESVLNQSYRNWQLIVVNDGSIDKTAEICKKYAANDSRIVYVEQANQGVSAARNNALQRAEGEWVSFLDSDDKLSPFAMEEMAMALKEDSQLVVCGYTKQENDFTKGGKKNEVTKDVICSSILDYPLFKKKVSQAAIGDYNHWSIWGRLFKKSIIMDNGILFSKHLKLGEDLLFSLQYAKKIEKAVLVDSKVYYYRINSGSVSVSFQSGWVQNTKKLLEELYKCAMDKTLKLGYYRFAVNRLYVCLQKFYNHPKCTLTKEEKLQDFKEFCRLSYINDAIHSCPFTYLDVGRKNNINVLLLLIKLKLKKYSSCIKD